MELDSNNPQEPASITASSFAGWGSTITLDVNEISARNGSQITAETKASGDGGSLNINSQNFKLSNSALLSTSSQGSGDAGTIKINGDKINIFSNSQITTDSTDLGQAGDINILFERLEAYQGKITPTSEQTGGGGDINITADIIAGFENSDITANAIEGNGGNIDITTQGLFGLIFQEQPTESSDITASSQFGVNGTVEINDFGIDPSSGLVELRAELFDESQKIANGCSSSFDSSFLVTGRGGLPPNPSYLFNASKIFVTLLNLVTEGKIQSNISTTNDTTNENNSKKSIIEATGFKLNQNGKIELIASPNHKFKINRITQNLRNCH